MSVELRAKPFHVGHRLAAIVLLDGVAVEARLLQQGADLEVNVGLLRGCQVGRRKVILPGRRRLLIEIPLGQPGRQVLDLLPRQAVSGPGRHRLRSRKRHDQVCCRESYQDKEQQHGECAACGAPGLPLRKRKIQLLCHRCLYPHESRTHYPYCRRCRMWKN